MHVRRGALLERFVGANWRVSRLWHGRQERVVTGLLVLPPAGEREGPKALMLGLGEAFVTIGLRRLQLHRFCPQCFGDRVRAAVQFSGLSGEWRFVADLAAYEESNSTRCTDDPTRCSPDSNPFGLLVLPDERVVADSGGNALLRVAADGEISTLAVLPTVPQARDLDAVPTSIALGPDAAFYVGVLTGAPFADGAANIYRACQASRRPSSALVSRRSTASPSMRKGTLCPPTLTADHAHGRWSAFRTDAAVLLQNAGSRNPVVQTGNTRLIRRPRQRSVQMARTYRTTARPLGRGRAH